MPFESQEPMHLDPVNWDQLIESLGPSSCIVVINSWLGQHLASAVSAEDIWQEALFMAWQSREQHEWRGVRPYRGWLLEIARNRVHDHGRRQSALKRGGGQKPALFSEMGVAEDATLGSLLPAGSTTPSRVASTNERAQNMQLALDELPEEQAVVIRMHLFEEREMADVAAELEIGLSAAWYRFRTGSEAYALILARVISVSPTQNG